MITVTIDDRQVRQALERLRTRLTDMTPVMTDIGEELVSRILDSFEREADPWGGKWAALSDATRKARARRLAGGKTRKKNGEMTKRYARALGGTMRILQDTGVLRSSIEIQSADRNSVTVGSRVPYAAVHQFGGGRAKVPSRPFFPIRGDRADLPQEWTAGIVALIGRHIEGAR